MHLANPVSIIYLFSLVTSGFYNYHLFILLCLFKFTSASFIQTHIYSFAQQTFFALLVIFSLIILSSPHSTPLPRFPHLILQAFLICYFIYQKASSTSALLFIWLSCSFHSDLSSNATSQEAFPDYAVQNNMSPRIHLFVNFFLIF